MNPGEPSKLDYESAVTPAEVTRSHLVGEWFKWTSVAITLDIVPFALIWMTSHGMLSGVRLRGAWAILLAMGIGGIACVTVVRLVRLAIRTRGVVRACYCFLAFINFKAGLFALAMLAIVIRF